MANRIKLLYIHQDLGVGGAEENRLVTLKYLDRKKYDVTLCSIDDDGRIGEEMQALGFRIVKLGKQCSFYNPSIMLKLWQLMARDKFKIVHTSLFYANLHGRIAAKLAGVPVIISEEQNIYAWKKIHPSFIVADRMLSKFTDKIIAVSDTVKDFTVHQESLPADKFIVIHNSFDIDRFNIRQDSLKFRESCGFSEEERLIGSVGSLCEQKGHVFLLRAMKEVLESNPCAKLLLIGEGDLRQKLAQEANRLGIADKVKFLGMRRDIPHLLQILDAFVFPSLWEGLPIALLEAMSCGKAIVASNIPSIAELLMPDEAGVLVPPEDPASLAQAIIGVLGDKDKAREMGRRARQRAIDNFSPSSCVSELEHLYDSLLRQKGIN